MTRPRHSMPRCLALAGLLAALASAPALAAESVGIPAAAPAASSLPVDPRAAVDATASAVLTPDIGSTAGPKPSSPATATTADSSAAPRRASAAPTDAQAAMPRPAIKRQRIATAQPVRRSAYRVAGCAAHGCDRPFVLMIGIGY